MDGKRKLHGELLWSGEVARYCGVTTVAVAKWIKRGQLKAFRTPGGRYRVRRQDFIEFLRLHNFPMPAELAGEAVPRVLIVEDEPSVAQMLRRALESGEEDYSIAVAENGFRAAYMVYSFRPDLIVLDIRLPGLEGTEVCRIVKEDPSSSHMKILVVSAYLDDATSKALKDAGAEVLLPKPVDIEKFQAAVKQLVFGQRRL